MRRHLLIAITLAGALALASLAAAAEPLPSWNEGQAKRAIVDFVQRVTTAGGADFVPVAERIAVFDNDGTLWSEQPMYFQLFFALDRVKALAPERPEWQDKQPFKAVLDGDMEALAASGSVSAGDEVGRAFRTFAEQAGVVIFDGTGTVNNLIPEAFYDIQVNTAGTVTLADGTTVKVTLGVSVDGQTEILAGLTAGRRVQLPGRKRAAGAKGQGGKRRGGSRNMRRMMGGRR